MILSQNNLTFSYYDYDFKYLGVWIEFPAVGQVWDHCIEAILHTEDGKARAAVEHQLGPGPAKPLGKL